MEVVVSSVIAVTAVIGLAHTFSLGRSQIDRFEVARGALANAQKQMERLTVLPPSDPDLQIGQHPATTIPFTYEGTSMGSESWAVAWFDDPGTAGANDLKRVTVEVLWTQGALTDTVRLTRLFPAE